VHRVEREGAVEVGHEQVWIRFLDDGAELLRDGRHMRRKSHAATALLRGVRGKATPGTPSPSRRPVFTVDGGVFITAVRASLRNAAYPDDRALLQRAGRGRPLRGTAKHAGAAVLEPCTCGAGTLRWHLGAGSPASSRQRDL